MGLLTRYKEEHPELKKASTSETKTTTTALNIPFKCTAYEGDYICGVRLDTNEEIKVRLKEIEQKANSRFKRVEVADFANPKSKYHAKPGLATFVAESCYHEKDNIFNSRWVKQISEDPQKTKTFIMNASYVSIKKKDDNGEREIIFIKTTPPDKAKKVNSVDELKAALSSFLNPRSIGSNPFAYVRISEIDNPDEVEFIEVIPDRVDREDGMGKKCVEGEISANKFMNSDDSKMIRDLLNSASESITVEVIPGAVLYPGSATKDNLVNQHPNAKKILEESFYIKKTQPEDGEQEQATRPELGYLKCTIATRQHADGTSYFTFVKPIHQHAEAISVKNLK